MTLADLIKDFLDTTKERLKTPISGAFLWSFIIYNWRPILFLFFSDTSIENKIIVINHEYCSFWAIFWPVVIATLYTLLLPKIMLLIDIDLAETKNERLTKRYEEVVHHVKQKTNVAKEEFLLKSEESGNKTIQEFNDQINSLKEENSTLKESIKQIQESNRITVEGLNKQLKNANEIIIQKKENIDEREMYLKLKSRITLDLLHIEPDLASKTLNAVNSLSFKEFQSLRKANTVVESSNGTVRLILENVSPKMLESLSAKKIIILQPSSDGTLELTEIGFLIVEVIKTF